MSLKKIKSFKETKAKSTDIATLLQLIRIVDGLVSADESHARKEDVLFGICKKLTPSPLRTLGMTVSRLMLLGADAGSSWKKVCENAGPLRRHLESLGAAYSSEKGEREALLRVLSVLESEVQNRFEQAVERAPILMLAPIVLLILPGIFVIVAAPILLDVLKLLN